MEDSMTSMSKSLSSKTTTTYNDHNQDEEEESGWTNYFDDFFANNNKEQQRQQQQQQNDNNSSNSFSSSCYDYQSSSSSLVISDAFSSVANKSPSSVNNNDKAAEPFPLERNYCKKLSFMKKRKTKGGGLVLDDALEDTASSPVHSPKVSQFNQLLEMKQKEKKNNIAGLFEKKLAGSGSGQTDERSGLGFAGRDSGCTELKKRGLCLVPLSMFVNYLG